MTSIHFNQVWPLFFGPFYRFVPSKYITLHKPSPSTPLLLPNHQKLCQNTKSLCVAVGGAVPSTQS